MGVVFGYRLDGGNVEGWVEDLKMRVRSLVGYGWGEQWYYILVRGLDSVKGRWDNCDDSGIEI